MQDLGINCELLEREKECVRVCVCVFSLKEIIVLYKKAQQNLNSV
jgi:hypothetical protein